MVQVLIPISWNVIGRTGRDSIRKQLEPILWPFIVIRKPELQMIQVVLHLWRAVPKPGIATGNDVGTVLASLPPLIVFIALQKQFLSRFLALTRDK